jgi:FkbM family methyltransferase
MLKYIREASRISKKKGTLQLVRELIRFFRNLPIELLYVLKGYQWVTVGDISVKVSIPDRSAARSVRFARDGEFELVQLLADELDLEDNFLDVGSHIGIITGFVSETQPDGRVIAIEPYPQNIEALKKTANMSDGAPIEIIEKALWNTREEITLSTPDLPGTRGLSSITKDMSGRDMIVEGITGDELVNSGRIPQPNIIKIDVEGAESQVIDGLRNTINSNECRLIICEIHLSHFDVNPDVHLSEIELKLEKAGFEISILHDRDMEIQILARRED